MNGSIFINPAILEQTYLPRLLPHREEQHKYLAECIKPLFQGRTGTNLLVVGSHGIGKTACVKYVFRELIEKTDNIMPIYINCWKRDTTPKIVKEIANIMGVKLIEKMSSDEIFDILIRKLSKFDGVVFGFDEIDRVQDYDFLYRILEDVPLKTIFLVTNITEWLAKVDRRLMSRLMLERLEFKPYNFTETKDILYERQKHAFAPDSWSYDAFEKLIRKAFEMKDVRVGLFLMRRAGEIANNKNSGKIEIKDVEGALEKLKDFYGKQDIGSFI